MRIPGVKSFHKNMTIKGEDFVKDKCFVRNAVDDNNLPERELQNCICVASHGFGKRPTLKFQTLLGLFICTLHLLSTGDAGRIVLRIKFIHNFKFYRRFITSLYITL